MLTRFCKRCLLRDGMQIWLHPTTLPEFVRPVRVGENAVCTVCSAYERWSSAPLRRQEREQLLNSDCRRAVALYSGGKDSTAMLVLAKEQLGFELTAVLYDNGFIPKAAVEQAQRVCDALAVELIVIGSPRATLETELQNLGVASPTPCLTCARGTVHAALDIARQKQTPWLFSGTNYFAEWKTVPLGIKVASHQGLEHRMANLPYVFELTRADTRRLLAVVGYENLKLTGVSTNCLVPARVQAKIADTLGHVPELEDLSLEILVGHVSRAEAVDELREKAPAHAFLLGER